MSAAFPKVINTFRRPRQRKKKHWRKMCNKPYARRPIASNGFVNKTNDQFISYGHSCSAPYFTKLIGESTNKT